MVEKDQQVEEQATDTVDPSTEAPADEVVAEETTTEATSDVDAKDQEIADLKAELEAAEDRNLRIQAETQNMQTRLKKEQSQALKYANQKLATDLLPAIDNLERAIQSAGEGDSADKLKQGVEMVLKSMQKALTDSGVTAVGAVGEAYDPETAQAIQTAPADDDHPADTIAEVLQKGYLLQDRVIRPAMVVVYA